MWTCRRMIPRRPCERVNNLIKIRLGFQKGNFRNIRGATEIAIYLNLKKLKVCNVIFNFVAYFWIGIKVILNP